MIKVQYLPANIAGRYFIISDPHGHFDHIIQLLKLGGFNPLVDHLIIDGDLVDRGPASMKCLKLMFQPWVTVVRGNHEENILRVMKNIMDAKDWGLGRDALISGAQMLLEQSPIAFDWLVDWLKQNQDWSIIPRIIAKLEATSHILVVGEGANRFNVVHANLHDAGITSDHDIDMLNGSQDYHAFIALIESKRLAKEALTKGAHGRIVHDKKATLSLTFCGHSIVPNVTSYKNHVFIDTGCYLKGKPWSGLTAVEWPSKRTYFVPSEEMHRRQSLAA